MGIVRSILDTVLKFLPPAALGGGELEHCVQRESNGCAVFNWCISKVCHQYLKDADVAHNEDRANLLFNIYHYGFQSACQISLALAPRKPRVERILDQLFVPIRVLQGNILQLLTCKVTLIERVQIR